MTKGKWNKISWGSQFPLYMLYRKTRWRVGKKTTALAISGSYRINAGYLYMETPCGIHESRVGMHYTLLVSVKRINSINGAYLRGI